VNKRKLDDRVVELKKLLEDVTKEKNDAVAENKKLKTVLEQLRSKVECPVSHVTTGPVVTGGALTHIAHVWCLCRH